MADIRKIVEDKIKAAPKPEECDKQIPSMVKGLNGTQKRLARHMLKTLLKRKGCSEEEIRAELEKIQ